VALPLGHVVLPWWISLHSVRHGWSGGLQGGWNLIAILPVSAGLAIIVWALGLHFVSAEQGWELEMTPSYLLVRGPYRFTRNPMYVAAIAIWFGWTVFYGSALVLVGLAVIWAAVEFAVVPFEERRLELRIGVNLGDVIVDGDDIPPPIDSFEVCARHVYQAEADSLTRI